MFLFFLDKGDDYEVRVYPASKWVCTKEYDVDPIKDPMNDWQDNVSQRGDSCGIL